MHPFIFATGIENSHPKIAGGVRVDEMEKCGHYERWREDLELTREIGADHLRWGPATYMTHLGPGKYDWSWVDEVLAEMRRLEIQPILDLCHFGLPDWMGDFQNPEFPGLFAEYAAAFAARYPHIELWTPINEMLVVTLFSARYGWWNECLESDRDFVRALLNTCRANVLAMQVITRTIPEALFIQSESSEFTHVRTPAKLEEAAFCNERRFLPLDLTYGHQLGPRAYRYMVANGMTEDEHSWFMNQTVRHRCVLGTDYYITNEHMLEPDGRLTRAGEVLGYYAITKEYWDRYRLPMMHTETNLWEQDNAALWLWKEWASVLRLRAEGVPVIGFTWYSLTDQLDWDSVLRQDRGVVNPVGLYDLDRNIREVGRQYQTLIERWRGVLTTPKSALRPSP